MALYSDKVMDHFQHPRNVGKLPDADGVGEVGNAKCGDIMRMYIQVDPETQVITDVKFNTFGCGSAIATSSMATEMIKGKPVSEALQLTNRAVVEALDGLPAHKLHCSVLAEEAVRAAIRDYYDRNSIPYGEELRACEGHCDTCGHEENASEQCSGALFLPIKNHRPRLARPRTGSSPRTSSQTGADSSGRWASSDSDSSERTKSYRRDIQRCRGRR